MGKVSTLHQSCSMFRLLLSSLSLLVMCHILKAMTTTALMSVKVASRVQHHSLWAQAIKRAIDRLVIFRLKAISES
jgi:hypothetical protein